MPTAILVFGNKTPAGRCVVGFGGLGASAYVLFNFKEVPTLVRILGKLESRRKGRRGVDIM